MATITLPVATLSGSVQQSFEIDTLSFARSITRQGVGARKAWRHHLTQSRFPVIQSDRCIQFDAMRAESLHTAGMVIPYYGIRAEYRRRMAAERVIYDAWRPIEEQTAPGADD